MVRPNRADLRQLFPVLPRETGLLIAAISCGGSLPGVASAGRRFGKACGWDGKMVGNAATTGWVGDMAPIAASDWTYERARHLLDRAGFGGTPDQIDRLYRLGPVAAVSSLVDFDASAMSDLPEFSHSPIYDPTLRNFPETRPAATRLAAKTGSAMGVSVKAGGPRRLQPVVDRFFFWLRASALETTSSGALVGGMHAALQAAAAGEDGAVLARAFRHRCRQGARLPQDEGAARSAAGARNRQFPNACWWAWRRIRRCLCSSMPAAT